MVVWFKHPRVSSEAEISYAGRALVEPVRHHIDNAIDKRNGQSQIQPLDRRVAGINVPRVDGNVRVSTTLLELWLILGPLVDLVGVQVAIIHPRRPLVGVKIGFYAAQTERP